MSWNRRTLFRNVLGAFPACAIWQQSAQAQAVAPKCSGTVSDAQGTGIANLIVQTVEPNGRVASSPPTDSQGNYSLPAPKSGTYVIVFREPQGNTKLHDVRQLTGGKDQVLSVTIDGRSKSFQGAYAALQAVETLTAWIVGDRKEQIGPELFKSIPLNELTGVVDAVTKDLNQTEPTARQRDFLLAKAESVRKFLQMVG
jgi:hypothetical protein